MVGDDQRVGAGIDGESYVETADSGGMDDCIPTIGACRVPGWVRTFGGAELPENGELWSQVREVEVRDLAIYERLFSTELVEAAA